MKKLLLYTLVLVIQLASAESVLSVLNAVDYGVVADGVTDDGPAIAQMVAAGKALSGDIRFVFPSNSTVRVETYPSGYLFDFEAWTGLEVDGGDSTFILAPELRFLSAEHSTNVVVRNLNVDFYPLLFAQGTVIAVESDGSRIYVEPDPGMEQELNGGPSPEPDQQAFYGFLWTDGPYGRNKKHYFTESVSTSNGIWIVEHDSGPNAYAAGLLPGEAVATVPVPGLADRMGPGALFRLSDNHNVTFDTVETWQAPWIVNQVFRNSGVVEFIKVHVRPKPGTDRSFSSWRDAFHVKGNSAKLTFDGCHIEATHDDAFNISTHSKRLVRVESPTTIVVRQNYVLEYMPLRAGHELVAADFTNGRIVGRVQVLAVEEIHDATPDGFAPHTRLWLDQPIAGLNGSHVIWQPDFTNPDTTLKNCTLRYSCRFQTSVTLENCDMTALAWFYGNSLEGPGPEQVVVRDSIIRRGPGNDEICVSFKGYEAGADDFSAPRLIGSALLENCDVYGKAIFQGIDQLSLVRTRFLDPARPPLYQNNQSITTIGYGLLGQYTFDHTGTGTAQQRMEAALAATNEIAGINLSPLGTNTVSRLDFAGFTNMPSSSYDGFGFGRHNDASVMFFERAESGLPSAWNIKHDTSAALQPLSFSISAGASHEVTVSNVIINTDGAAPDFIFSLQEAGAALGPSVTHGSPWDPTAVALNDPVVIAPGASKTFTLYMNSGAFGQTLFLNSLSAMGSVEQIASPMEAWAAGFGLRGDARLPSADPDEDQVDNLLEYGLGGNPVNAMDTGYPLRFSGDVFVHPRLSDPDSGVRYRLEISDNLVSNVWTTNGYTVSGVSADGFTNGVDAVSNQFSTSEADQKFVRLVIEEL